MRILPTILGASIVAVALTGVSDVAFAAASRADVLAACDRMAREKDGSCGYTKDDHGNIEGCTSNVCFVCPRDTTTCTALTAKTAPKRKRLRGNVLDMMKPPASTPQGTVGPVPPPQPLAGEAPPTATLSGPATRPGGAETGFTAGTKPTALNAKDCRDLGGTVVTVSDSRCDASGKATTSQYCRGANGVSICITEK
jgi:hypothetical protein